MENVPNNENSQCNFQYTFSLYIVDLQPKNSVTVITYLYYKIFLFNLQVLM